MNLNEIDNILNKCEIGVPQTSRHRLSLLSRVIAKHLEGAPKTRRIWMLEVGSYEGVSAVCWSNVIGQLGFTGVIRCVDPWQAYLRSEHQPAKDMDDDMTSGKVLDRFRRNVSSHAHPEVPVSPWVGTLDELFRVSSQGFSLAYIDGCHRYSAAAADIRLAWNRLYVGGLLLGDDLEREVATGDAEAIAHAEDEYHDGYHPGVSLAVARAFGPGGVWADSGVWAVRKLDGTFWTKEGISAE